MPAAVAIAAKDEDFAKEVQATLSTDRFRAYINDDVVGTEIASALKNVIAIAAGISDGLGFGDNAKAALLTRGMVEMSRLGVALGGQRQTFSGLAGIGDLITTCVSPHGRNRAVGERIGRGETLSQILDCRLLLLLEYESKLHQVLGPCRGRYQPPLGVCRLRCVHRRLNVVGRRSWH